MSIHAADTTLNQFLNPSESVIYEIPKYQREYSWRQEHCEALLNDILENDPYYFIGSIIWITESKEIIDGQQRLTSLNLLLIAIYLKYCELPSEPDIDNKKVLLYSMLVANKRSRLILQNQGKNKEDFEHLVNYYVLKGPYDKPTNFGNRRVGHNFKFFQEAIKDMSIEEINILYDKICKLTFISAKVDDSQTAFILFETMNNRGMDLSAIDLIKNTYMSRYSNAITNWENLISILGNESNQEQFLRNNYNAFRKEYNNIEGPLSENVKYAIANKATRSNVIKIYDKIINQSNFMQFITMNAKYNALLTGEENQQLDVCKEYKEAFKNFRNANATSAFTLLLFLLRYQNEFSLSENEMIDIYNLMLKFFVRRNLTNIPSTGALPQIEMDIISDINSLKKPNYKEIYNIMLNTFKSKSAGDGVLLEVLNGDIYDTNRDMARFILCSLCKDNSNNEKRLIDLWEKRDEKYIWTIEHILPEGNKDASNTPSYWIDMIRKGDSSYENLKDSEIIKLVREYRHKFGNLTMTGYNSSLGNKSFSDKKDRFIDGQEVGYNNKLSLNEDVVCEKEWNISKIIKRTEKIVNEIKKQLDFDIK